VRSGERGKVEGIWEIFYQEKHREVDREGFLLGLDSSKSREFRTPRGRNWNLGVREKGNSEPLRVQAKNKEYRKYAIQNP